LGILGLVINIMITQVQQEKDAKLTKLYLSEQDRTLKRVAIFVSYDHEGDVFRGSLIQVVELAKKAVQALGWKVDQVDEDLGLVNFTTGITIGSWSGVSGTISIKEESIGVFKVTGTGKQNLAGWQLIAFDFRNEAQGKAMSVISKMKEFAGANKSVVKTAQAASESSNSSSAMAPPPDIFRDRSAVSAVQASATPTPEPSTPQLLRIRAKKDTWVRVVAIRDGKEIQLFEDTIHEDDTLPDKDDPAWSGDFFVVTTREAADAEIIFNESNFGTYEKSGPQTFRLPAR
jgi:hypothetical protein